MINNFDLIEPLLSFNSGDEFYFVQIIQRKKDNMGVKGTNNNNRLIRAYYITSITQLLKLQEEMIALANYFNARVGINLNKRSFEKTAFNTLKKIAEQMHNKDYYNVRRAYNSACGIHNSVDDKRWIIDIDWDLNENPINNFALKSEIIGFINSKIKPEGIKTIQGIPSKNGWHIITSPFNTETFVKAYPDIDIHKNNPTNLYIP